MGNIWGAVGASRYLYLATPLSASGFPSFSQKYLCWAKSKKPVLRSCRWVGVGWVGGGGIVRQREALFYRYVRNQGGTLGESALPLALGGGASIDDFHYLILWRSTQCLCSARTED